MKTFTDSGAFGGFTAPEIYDEGLVSYVYETHSGPRIWWEITYYIENEDTEPQYFILWDKWGGNLMALNAKPTAFVESTNTVTLSNGHSFVVDPNGYKAEIGSGFVITTTAGADEAVTTHGTAYITLHTGDKQEGTNPGKGKGTTKDGKSYDTDIRWEIGLLNPGESATLKIYVAPGKNPGGQLQFSSPGCLYINTGPRARVYEDETYHNRGFLYSIEDTNKLKVCVDTAVPILDEEEDEVGVAILFGSESQEDCLEMHIWINSADTDDIYDFTLMHAWREWDGLTWVFMWEYLYPDSIVVTGGMGEFHTTCIPIPQDSRYDIHEFSISLTGQAHGDHLDTDAPPYIQVVIP
jgi:hypothetical protein